MKNYLQLIFLALFIQSCSFGATPTPVPTTIPTPVGYGVEFPFDFNPTKEWGENVTETCSQSYTDLIGPDIVRKLVAAGGKLETTIGEDANLTYLWTGNVPLGLFVDTDEYDTGFVYYEVSGTSYCVSGLDESGSSAYITVITKIMPQQ